MDNHEGGEENGDDGERRGRFECGWMPAWTEDGCGLLGFACPRPREDHGSWGLYTGNDGFAPPSLNLEHSKISGCLRAGQMRFVLCVFFSYYA